MKSSKKINKNNLLRESTASYLTSSKHCNDSEIILSTLQKQEEANYIYWLSLTPEERFELHYILITQFFSDTIKKNIKSTNNTIHFE
jgi:hypothetical protein